MHMVCLKQSKLYVLQNVIGVIYLNGQWPYWPTTLFEICPHKPNAMIKWIKMVYFGLASCQLFQFWQERPSFWLESGGLCYTCCVCWQGPDYFINQLLVWSLTLFVRRIHVEDFILSLTLLSYILVSPCHFFSLLSRYASISSRNHSNIHKCWQTHFKLVFSQALSALKSV